VPIRAEDRIALLAETKSMTQPEVSTSKRPKAVRIRLLGSFRVSVGSRTIQQDEWRLRKAAALVKLLALTPGHRLHREQVIEVLWPESGAKAASNNLRQVIYSARGILDPASDSQKSYLGQKDEHLILCPDGQLWVDVDAFEEAATTARRSKDPATYRVAIDLYAGDLLPENRYEGWAEGRREELRQLYLALLLELASLYQEREEHALAIEALRKATAEEPTLEEAYASLMRLHAVSGRPERALSQYERLCDNLTRALGTRPAETTGCLRNEIAAGRLLPTPSTASAEDKTSEAVKHNLSAPRTSFIGRDQEMVEVKRALAMTRLLTLTGAGGTGKTRLSLELARDLIGSYPDGVWLVELAPLSKGDLVTRQVAGILEVQEHPGQALIDTLAGALATRKVLLLLDNCEHLVGEVAHLVDSLLDSCSRLRILATSREPLGVSGEVIWAVSPLSLPNAADVGSDRKFTEKSLMGYEAVRLFVDRARLRLPDFGLTPENAGAVARVCRKLDGIPLAIELATARMGTLAVEQVAQKLEVSLDLLKGTSRTAQPRQQTLRATLDWSHNLLSKDEQMLFRRFSVFAGGGLLEATEIVCSGGGVEEGDVLDLLEGLVNKSLVVAEASTGDIVRYRMLEPIRQYAREKLEESGDADKVQNRHAEFFLALAEEVDSAFGGAEGANEFHPLGAEHDNMRAALSWSLEGGDPGLGLRMAAALSYYWDLRGNFGEGVRWLQEALAKGGATVPTARFWALTNMGNMLRQQSEFERAEACHEEALKLCEELGDRGGVAESLAHLGFVAEKRHDTERATRLLEKSMEVARDSGNTGVVTGILRILARIAFDSGDFERARSLRREAVTSAREQNIWGNSGLLCDVGYHELALGNHEQAMALLEESLAISRELGDKWVEAACLLSLGNAATLRGEPNQAMMLLREGIAMWVEFESKPNVAAGLEGLAEAVSALGEELRAVRLWGAAAALREVLDVPWSPVEQLLHEPQLIAARSRLDEAMWEAAFAEGRGMSFEEVVEYALSDEEPATAATLTSGRLPVHSPPTLTRREKQVACLVAHGLSNREIAQELHLSERTVHAHLRAILKKLGVPSREQVASRLTG
jgi:predicted ATPase/DNA-binding SARP family transcriptional activator/DNA-binding CsgD family transcriptional regulator